MHTRGQISTQKRKLESLTPAPTTPSSSARFTRLPGDGSVPVVIPVINLDSRSSEHIGNIVMGGTPCELSLTPQKELSSENDDCAGSQAVGSQQ